MRLALIAALARNRVIGIGNHLPWHLPADLTRFKALTMGKPILMGRRTFESIGRPLPGRRNLVLTRDSSFDVAGCEIARSLDEALMLVGDAPEVMVIGGAQLYTECLPRAYRLYLTHVETEPEGDAFFPILDPGEWIERERSAHAPDDKNPYHYAFVTYDRRI
jgi:dihydrofolate reductase